MSRILIVDDSPIEQTLLTGLLKTHFAGAEIVCSHSGPDALELISQNRPDLVLTDLHMEEMSGLELIREVRSRDESLPVILMTGRGSEETAVQAILAGAASYIPKSQFGRYLFETIDSVLRLSQKRSLRLALMQSLVHQDLRFCLANDPRLVTPFVEMVQQQVAAAGQFTDSEVTRVCMALHEALTNAIYHGNLELDSELRQEDDRRFYALGETRRHQSPYRERRVYVAASLTDDNVDFRIRDEGPGFDGQAALAKLQQINLERIGGRGLLLIHSFMDTVSFNAVGNEIRFSKRAAATVDTRTSQRSAALV